MKAYKKKEIIIKRGGTEIQKQSFHQYEGPISIKNIDINKIVVSDKVSFDKKGVDISLASQMLKNRPLFIFFFKNEST